MSERYSLVVLGPPSEETPPNVVVEDKGERNTSPRVGQVVGGPDETTIQEYGRVEVLKGLDVLAEEVEWYWQEGANEETPQEDVVDGTGAVHFLGTEGTPKDGSGEEGVNPGTGEPILLVGSANIRDAHLVVEDRCANKGRYERRNHLAIKRDPRRDVDIMGEFEILSEVKGMRSGDVSVRLEVVHGSGVTREPETSEQLGDDVQGDLDVGDRLDDTARNTEDEGEENTIQHDGGCGLRGVGANTGGTESDGDDKDGKVDVFRNLLVAPHETSVDILGVSEGRLAANQVLESSSDLTAVVEEGVCDGRGVDGEEHAVDEGVGSREVHGGVSLVGRLVEETVLVDGFQNLVTFTGIVEHAVSIDGNVSRIPGIGVPNSGDDREGEEGAEEGVEDTVEGIDEGVTSNNALIPIPSGERVQSQTTVSTGNRSQVDVVGSDPGSPVEVGHSSDEVVGEPEVYEHGAEAVSEPPHPRNLPAIGWSVGFGVESPVERDCGQVSRPDSAGWVHKETAGEAGETVTDEISREGNEDLVAEVPSPGLVEVEREKLDPDDVRGVGGSETDVGHDGNDHVLLHVKFSGVEAPGVPESGVLGCGEDGLKNFTGGVSTERNRVRNR